MLFTDVVHLQRRLSTTVIIFNIIPSVLTLFSLEETVYQSKLANRPI
jgi:hypothetical protein